ncbi:MAG TPA: hypothetical protein VKA74_16770 [Myxococcota bacterium]|nr:hypothetical protein [Myxococcota bacterium]HKK94407.1 hypothetical protein [Longimicrobiales bacterium]
MRTSAALALFTLFALALLPSPGAAQVRFDGLDISGGYWGWEGQDFTDVEAGPRLGVAPLLRIGEFWNVGVEAVYATAEVQLVAIPIDIKETGVNGIVRRYLADPNDVHAYVQARGGWSRLESDIAEGLEGQVLSYEQSGLALGAELGVGFPAGRYIDVLWAGGFGWNSYTQCEVFGQSGGYRYIQFGDDCSAIRWGVRVGIVLGRSDG